MRHSFFRSTAIFILILSLGVGHSWADEITVYVTGEIFIGTGENAWDNATSTIKVDVRKGHPECFDCDGFNGLYNQDMTNTGYTYNGYPIYSYTLNQAGAQFRFKHYKSGAFKENYTTDWHSTTNQIYQGYYSEAHHWITYGRDVTFYATPEKMDGSKWKEGTHSLFANFKYGDGESEWKRQQMTKTAYTYNGYAIYTCTMLLPYNVIKKVQFLYNDGSDKELYAYEPSPQLTANDVDGKILLGWNGSSHNWVSYGRDVTIYTIPDYLFKDKETPFNESTHYPAVCIQMGSGSTWNTVNMTKTSYKYATYPIYKATILIDQNKFWEFQIKYFNKSGDSQVDLYQFNNYEPKTEYAPSYIDDKLYHGYNGSSHDFFSYRYDVALDRQSGGGGATSIIAIDGSAMPSATMPGRDGYEFGGYWTEPNGGGTQYYNSDGSSTRNWDSRTITTLYAKWTANNYNVNLENLDADEKGTENVSVTYNSSVNLTKNITIPQKAHYDFGGYYTSSDGGVTLDVQLINEKGAWIASVDGYTDDAKNWLYTDNLILFAKWEEIKYTVDVVVSPAEAGVVQVNGQTVSSVPNVGYATHSPELTAVPSNAVWVFKEWQVTSEAHLDLERYKQDKPTMKITATGADQKLTAVFEKRYNLVGSKYELDKHKPEMATGGMPGWTFGSGADFTINSYTPNGDNATVDLSYTCTLEKAELYIFEIHDREKKASLGRKNGDKIYVLNDGGSVELQGGEHQDQSIFFYPRHEGQYTFRITYMRKDSDFYYPTVTVERPHQLHMGHVHAEIDNTSATNSGDTGGTLSATIGGSPIYNDGWYGYGADITYTALPATGYTIKWYTDNTYSSEFSEQPANSWTHSNVTDDENVYVRFTEIPTAVTLSNDGHGKIQIDGVDKTETTVGVTTHRELTAVPDEGYKLNSWTIVSGNDIALSSTSTNPTTLSGLGAGAVSGQEVRANFVERWALSAESEGWGSKEFSIANVSIVAGKAIGYVDIELPANTDLQFKMVDKQTGEDYKSGSDIVYYMTNGNSYNWSFATEKAHNCGITTAGAGTYRFMWNITDKTMSVIYPNFVIYRTGDKDEDSESATHTITSPVESYEEGGTIEKAIEFRMKVRELDKWYTLCLPFEVNKVCVWDNVDGAYYDIVPYYRPTLGGTFYTGHYIIRKPVTTTNFAIEGFEGRDRWIDPESSNVLPSKNIPYIIQWHDSYFLNKYISFFGDTNQDIPSDFNAGAAPSENDVVNIFGNNTMHNGTVRDAYLLDKDYGPSGAWLREDIGRDRTILPFECFILANNATTTRYRILRRGMEETDTPTALEQISNHQSPMTIRVYTITGVLIGEYNDCSFQDAAHRIATDHNEGIYILRSENESMKLLLGGK